MPRESAFQRELIKELREMFPGCIILKNDSGYLQGVPDLMVLIGDLWAALECKAHAQAATQPNQDHYVSVMRNMSFAAFVYPENKDAILHELQLACAARRSTRLPERQ